MRVFTVGTDHRKQYDFTRILFKYGIQVIFDIRRVPEAQEEYYRRDGLDRLVSAQRMDYVYLGNELGGPRMTDYSEWTGTDEFRRGLEIIRSKAARRVCCLLCVERSPELCHRRIICEHLEKAGIEIVHLLDENAVWQPPPRRETRPASRPRGRRGPGAPGTRSTRPGDRQ